MKITNDIYYVGVNDHQVDLFEGQYRVPLGMAYNSYVIMDEKVAVMDTADIRFTKEWLDNLSSVLKGRKPDYLIIQHMEPDHSANIKSFLVNFPGTPVVSNEKAFKMMDQFFGADAIPDRIIKGNGDTLELGRHTLTFVFAPMVHWPEVMVTYDSADKLLFSADGFGKFGANDVEDPQGWLPEARRYFIGIVGKYGAQVQRLLQAAAGLEIHTICATHGPMLTDDVDNYLAQLPFNQDTPRTMLLSDSLAPYLKAYNTWSSYTPEEEGVTIAYTTVYGHTREAAMKLAAMLQVRGVKNVAVFDLARDDMPEAVASAFRYSKLVLATTTYNAEIYPFMRTYIENLTERNFQKRTVGLIENGTWVPMAKTVMTELLSKARNIHLLDTAVTIRSALNAESNAALERMADELSRVYVFCLPSDR